MTVLVLGATGLLGHAVFRRFRREAKQAVIGTIRQDHHRELFEPGDRAHLTTVEDLENIRELTTLVNRIAPTVIVNCLAAPKQPQNSLRYFMMYAVLPQRLAQLCRLRQCRMIQMSSDGVFSGSRGFYNEDDVADASDCYGIAKLLGEVRDPHTITLRTSIIGHELRSRDGLLEWFLTQKTECQGYTQAVFSGFPNVVLADILHDVILPRPDLSGIYHLASEPISKFDLLTLIASRYQKDIRVIANDSVIIDRSLNGARFTGATSYQSPAWPLMVDMMYRDRPKLEAADV